MRTQRVVYSRVASFIYLAVVFGFFQFIIGVAGALCLVGLIVLIVFLVEKRHVWLERQHQEYISWYKQQQKRSQHPQPPPTPQEKEGDTINPMWGRGKDALGDWWLYDFDDDDL